MAEILNKARFEGNYNDETPVFVETELTVETVALSIVKTADRTLWGDDVLTYTIVVTNEEANIAVTEGKLVDTLPFALVDLVENSVTVRGVVTAYTYNDTTGVLEVNLGTLAGGEAVTITFQVTQK